ncbi:hypothetical protein CK501_02020 [Halovibrio salipaludis]|uniref:Uncharacterized protein n=1 Tax=Halovibrio salipaludis TaxID=2032626 RepID=A0A2A2FBE8_9GAMM|nr:hypothetical protein [Halovibrio salipaludis]PAU81949.1 hypothetical protein CK501_02020 [Halovibrio salipaludis]
MTLRQYMAILFTGAVLALASVPIGIAAEPASNDEPLTPSARLLYKISFCGSVAETQGRNKQSEAFLEINRKLEAAILENGWSSAQLASAMQSVISNGFPELEPEPTETMPEFARRTFTEKRCQSILNDISSRIEAGLPSPETTNNEGHQEKDP